MAVVRSVLVTGAGGFLGQNLVFALSEEPGLKVIPFDVDTKPEVLEAALGEVDFVVHLAGVNRPKDESEFIRGNVDFTRQVVDGLLERKRFIPVILASSIQAALDNPYGRSKRAAEDILENYAENSGAAVFLFRMPNLFGKWCRPGYNSAVATFCHNIVRDLPVTISDPARELQLTYVDDVVGAFRALAVADSHSPGVHRPEISPSYTITLGDLVAMLQGFREGRRTLVLPDFSKRFVRNLYATYLSHLPQDGFAYDIAPRTDLRGSLFELMKSPPLGQIFVSTTHPGITRGNHFHHTKVEKFCVLSGEAIIRFRSVLGAEVLTYRVLGNEMRVVDIPPGYTHSIEHVGKTDMIVLFWASEPFDPENPDTIASEVLHV